MCSSLKTFSFLFSFIILLISSSCEKNQPNSFTNKDIIGQYEWSWSLDSTSTVVESSNSDNYAILVREDGFIFTYKNGKAGTKYRFHQYFEQWDKLGVRSYKNLRTKKVEDRLVFLWENNELFVFNFPYSHENRFYKVD
ncbi:MAG: hypothetical protein ACI8ZM_001345 [Crocinitomix sp.]|jgi:hypothetical protein